jgi:diguanylate cyclase
MKQDVSNGTQRIAVPLSEAQERGFTSTNGDEAIRLRRVLAEAAFLKQALATRTHEMQAALNTLQKLRDSNSRLIEDLARLQKKDELLRALAYHDELTGLPNRRLLRDRLHQALAHAMRYDKQVVLVLIDLDGFKSVNDRLGHTAGDRLLESVAERLSACVRAADTACRYGGDEFVIMLPEVEHEDMATAVVSKVRRRLGEPHRIGGFEIRMGASIGAVSYPKDGQTPEQLMKGADDALYCAKATRRDASITRRPFRATGFAAVRDA